MKREKEAGTTLVELLAAISIMAIISFALTEAVVQALRTLDGTATRYGESIDAQSLAASFGPDIQSADRVEAPFTPDGTDPCTPSSGSPLLLVTWTDGSVVKQASYTLEAASGNQRHLVRRYCEADSRLPDTAARLVRQHAVASLVPPEAPEPQVTCAPAPCSPQPDQVTMTITYPRPPQSPESFVATGSRRAR